MILSFFFFNLLHATNITQFDTSLYYLDKSNLEHDSQKRQRFEHMPRTYTNVGTSNNTHKTVCYHDNHYTYTRQKMYFVYVCVWICLIVCVYVYGISKR